MFTEIITNSNESLDFVHGFTVSTASDFVSIVNIGAPASRPILRNAALDVGSAVYGQKLFQPNDYLKIVSMGVILPLAFEFYNPEIWIFPYWLNAGGATRKIDELTSITNETGIPYLYYKIPFANSEIIIDVPIEYPASFFGTQKISLAMEVSIALNSISMINVPTSLNGKTFKIVPFMKIQHTLPMYVG